MSNARCQDSDTQLFMNNEISIRIPEAKKHTHKTKHTQEKTCQSGSGEVETQQQMYPSPGICHPTAP